MPRIKDSKIRQEITDRFLKALDRVALERDLIIQEVADKLGTLQPNLSRMRDPNNNSGVTIELLYLAYKEFGISPTAIISGKEDEPNKVLEQINKRLDSIEKIVKKDK